MPSLTPSFQADEKYKKDVLEWLSLCKKKTKKANTKHKRGNSTAVEQGPGIRVQTRTSHSIIHKNSGKDAPRP